MNTEMEFYQDDSGDHRWRLTDKRNGEILCASSEGFARESIARENLRLTLRGMLEHVDFIATA